MLRKIFKITGIVLGSVITLIAAYYTKVYISTENRMHTKYDVQFQTIPIPTDSAALALGARLVVAKGCTECHGHDLSGQVFVDDPALGILAAANLTKGKGGLPKDYDTKDWVRALKHGLRRDRTPLILMPAHEFTFFSEVDMGAIIAFCSTLPSVDHELPKVNLGPLARILADAGKLTLFPAELIDHNRSLSHEIKPEISLEYGKYVSITCQGCHKETMKGGDPIAPGNPPVADLTSTGNPGKWTTDQFIQTLRTGVTPEGKVLNPKEMPWTITKEFTDVELKAVHLYLKTL